MATICRWRPDEPALQAMLEARRQELTSELQRRMERIRETGTNPLPADDLERVDEGDVDVQMVEITSSTLRRIEQAIERLAHGLYGWCARCRAPIGEARLQAMPFAVHCHTCETRRERHATRSIVPRRERAWLEEA